MDRRDLLTLFLIIVAMDVLVRLLVINPMFGASTNKIAGKLF